MINNLNPEGGLPQFSKEDLAYLMEDGFLGLMKHIQTAALAHSKEVEKHLEIAVDTVARHYNIPTMVVLACMSVKTFEDRSSAYYFMDTPILELGPLGHEVIDKDGKKLLVMTQDFKRIEYADESAN